MIGFSLALVPRVLSHPGQVFAEVARQPPAAGEVFWGYAFWLGLLPPVSACIGSVSFGWRLGAGDPLTIDIGIALAIAILYYFSLLAAFIAAALIARWMGRTYAAEAPEGSYFALIALVGTPLMVGGLFHLYPSVVLNVTLLMPAFLWSAMLLYRGLPVLLGTGPERGQLMASAVLGFMLVAIITFLALTMVLWVNGIGPRQLVI